MRGTLGHGAPLAVYDLGTVEYEHALKLQHALVARRQSGAIPDTLLLLEHPPVITQGKSAVAQDILLSPEERSAYGVEVVTIERGGETTYHGPGQLVGYPIVDLRQHLRSLKRYVYLLEELFVGYLAEEFGVVAGRDPEHRGVWVGREKITAIGVAVQHRVTFHGFAFNVTTDLSHFNWIVPCGITDRGQTSLAACTGTFPSIADVKRALAPRFAELFGFSYAGLESRSAGELIVTSANGTDPSEATPPG